MAGGKAAAGAAKAGFKVFPVGKLLRRVKGLRSKADEAAMAARRGVSPPTRPRRVGQPKNWRAARTARDDAHDALVRKKNELFDLKAKLNDPNTPQAEKDAIARRLRSGEFEGVGRAKTVTGATDPETGITRTGHNGPGDADGWGCAEKYALDAINEERARMVPPKRALNPDEVDFSEALAVGDNVGDRIQKPVDGACQRRTNPEQFPNGTEFYTNDPSSQGSGWAQRYGIPT
jgi:hypothetical protein